MELKKKRRKNKQGIKLTGTKKYICIKIGKSRKKITFFFFLSETEHVINSNISKLLMDTAKIQN